MVTKAPRELDIGYELPSVTIKAVMRFGGGSAGPSSWDPEKWKSDVHEHRWARERGYRAGLAEGPPHVDHIILMLVDLVGEAWYGSGKISVKFTNPMYHGDILNIGGKLVDKVREDSGTRLVFDVWIKKEDGTQTARGTASVLVD